MDLEYLRASDGDGPAAPATVTAPRSSSATALTVDATTNWPQKFIATSGVYNAETKSLDIETIQVFLGHLDGTQIIIDDFAAGFADIGNSVGDKVYIKPATEFANRIVDFMQVAHKDDGSIRQVDGDAPGLVFSAAETQPDPDPDGKVTVWFKPL